MRGFLTWAHPGPPKPMRWSRYPITTVKEDPSEAEVVSHQLMLRAGLIRRLAAGIYTWTPLGLRSLRKVETIVREEMDRAGAFEVLMPAVQPAELWQESGRWEKYGPELLRLKDRHERGLRDRPDPRGGDHRPRAPRTEELSPAAGQFLPDPDQVPRRDPAALRRDARPRIPDEGRLFVPRRRGLAAGGLRAMRDAYTRMFERMGLEFRAVQADTGTIGGNASDEFQVLADSGEDAIAVSDGATATPPTSSWPRRCRRAAPRAAAPPPRWPVPTPGKRTIAEVAAFLADRARADAQAAAGRGHRRRRRGPARCAATMN